MSISKIAALSILLAYAEARFGQEQIPVAAVQALDGFGNPGVAATLAGGIPSSLLAAAGPCAKLELADQIVSELGDDPAVIEAAKGLVAAETNFNPFAVDVPFVCADASLPATEALRGVIALVDPDVDGAATANAASAASLNAPFDAAGLSQADIMIAQGFSNFQAQDASGSNVEVGGQAGGNAGGDAGADNGADAGADAGNGNNNNDNGNGNGNNNQTPPVQCGNGNANNGNGNANNGNGNNNADNGNGNDNADNGNGNDNADNGNGNDNADNGNGNDNADNGNDADAGAGAGNGNVDFGLCTPTIALVGGLNGRPETELTFIPTDPLVAEGQQEALNPNIITNRICDQLTNVCDASAEAVALCESAQAEIEALGTRDQSTADTWNALLGFAGASTTL